MPFKINLGFKGKTWKVESNSEAFIGMKLGDKIDGKDLLPDLAGYEFEIAGASDKAGFPAKRSVEGPTLRKLLLKKGWGMWTSRPKGLRRKKTVRGNVLSSDIVQMNLRVVKEGSRKFDEIFPEQNKPKEKTAEKKAETVPAA